MTELVTQHRRDGVPLSRRNFLKAAGAAGVTLLAAHSSSALAATGDITLSRVSVPLAPVHSRFAGLRIGFASDFHHGMFVPESWIQLVADLLMPLKLDLFLLGGDYIWLPDRYPRKLLSFQRGPVPSGLTFSDAAASVFRNVARILSTVPTRYGIYGVRGNHDCWTGKDRCVQAFAAHRIPLLVNDQVQLPLPRGGVLEVIGVDDWTTSTPALPEPVPSEPSRHAPLPDRYRILLAHNPDYIGSIASPSGLPADLVLSGHTHGGQIRLPGIGAVYFNVRDHRFVEGLVAYGHGHVYTSRGVGVSGLPFRWNCPPEVTVLELHAAGS